MKFDDWKAGNKMTGKTKTGADYEIVEQVGVLNESKNGISLELNRISYNGKAPVWDIRRWGYDAEGNRVMRAGISLYDSEVEALKKILWG